MGRVSTGKVALAVVLLSESVLFGTLLAAYAAMRDQAHWEMGHGLPQIAIPLANTAVLLFSLWPASRAAAWARTHHSFSVRGPLALGLVLGLVFAAGQVFEFLRAGLRVDDAAFGGPPISSV